MSEVVIRRDEDSEMMEILVDGKPVFEGNFWDFSIDHTLPSLLEDTGVTVVVEGYEYE